MIDSNKENNLFIIVIFILLLVSIVVTYDRYIVRQDFQYFVAEEDIPDQFNSDSYK